jgi:hypothetical protein
MVTDVGLSPHSFREEFRKRDMNKTWLIIPSQPYSEQEKGLARSLCYKTKWLC